MSSFRLVKLTDPIQFTTVDGGLVPRGAYAAGTDYAVGDSVDYQGSSYVMHTDAAAGTLPTNTTYWQVLASKGDTGPMGTGDLSYSQSFTNQTSVTVNHNLDKFPSVTVIDSANDEVECRVTHVSDISLTLTFTASFTGIVYCN